MGNVEDRARIVQPSGGQIYVYEGTGNTAPVTLQASYSAADSRANTVDTGKGFTYPPRGDRKQ